jgi:tetratricopeptide (TPR) repeat protein
MGQFDYDAAVSVFGELLAARPEWPLVQANLAIAHLNRQLDGDEERALELSAALLEDDPDYLPAHYVQGLLKLYRGEAEAALPHFRAVAEGDPGDAYAGYFVAQCLAQLGRHEEALPWFQAALENDPYQRSAYYGAFLTLQRLGRRDEAAAMLARYQRLEDNPRAHLVEFKYTRMGKRGEAQVVGAVAAQVRPLPTGPLLAPASVILEAGEIRGGGPVTVTTVDMQGDGRSEAFLAGAFGGDAPNGLLRLHEGQWALDRDHPLARVPQVNSAAWGDVDNDGLVDAYLLRNGPNQLWRQVQTGVWRDQTADFGAAAGDANSVDGAFLDADHDGDLDLFIVNRDAPDELLNNNLDGSFRPLAAERGLGGRAGSRQLLALDLDSDRDLDLAVLADGAGSRVFWNDRLWSYRPATGFELLAAAQPMAAVAGDADADGHPEIYTVSAGGRIQRWTAGEDRVWREQTLGALSASPWWRLALLDLDGRPGLELAVGHAGGWRVMNLQADAGGPLEELSQPLSAWWPMVLDFAAGPALLGIDPDGRIKLWAAGAGRPGYATLRLSGRTENAESMRSNASGLGARLAARVGSGWTVQQTGAGDSGPGQSLTPLSVGAGGQSFVDFVAIDWSDGVFQTELALATGQLHSIAETQRQLSSCPVLFSWNGSEYVFVTDFLGVGGIGYAIGPGQYSEPRPWENLLIPGHLIRADGDRYRLKVTEPMEELAYIDAIRLVAYDLPPGWSAVLDERLATAAPEATGELRTYRRIQQVARAVNDRGEDVTRAIRTADLVAAPPGELDHRFIGRLEAEHVLTLAFEGPLDAEAGQPMLIMDGWVEYPYSQTQFAAWQAGAAFEPPTLEVRLPSGDWQPLLSAFGYPAGMPRQASVPLIGLPPGVSALRLRSNQEIYWDRLFVAYAESAPEIRRVEMPLLEARLRVGGFARRSTGPQRQPRYDHADRAVFWDTRYPAGFYTRLGPVRELVAAHDDAVVIVGPGEELDLSFGAAAPPGEGRRRLFVLETHGWAKDMDLFTRDGETVGPLPVSGAAGPARDELHRRYHTRHLSGF